MLFKKKTPAPPSVRICSKSATLYQGLLKDIPLKESAIIENSIRFFDDPEPCFIHRNAVRIRLTEELHQELLVQKDEMPGSLFLSVVDLSDVYSCQLL